MASVVSGYAWEFPVECPDKPSPYTHPVSAGMGEGAGDWKSELSYSQRSGQPPAGSQLSGAQNQLSVIKQGVWIFFWSS